MAETKGLRAIASTSKKAEELAELLNKAGVTQEIIDSGDTIKGEIRSTETGTEIEITSRTP